jgi:undecaprenyl-diphosphatase
VFLSDFSTAVHSLTGHVGAIDEFMRVTANYLIYASLLILVALWFHRAGLRAGVAVGIGALLALGIGQLLASVFPESRPFVADHFTPLIPHAADGSFPSDHLLVLGAVVGGCLLSSRPLAALAAALAVLVAVARVYVGIHHPIDVVAGFAIGGTCGVGVWIGLAPLQSTIDRLDTELQRRGLRRIDPRGSTSMHRSA